jgi:hypothetical protein
VIDDEVQVDADSKLKSRGKEHREKAKDSILSGEEFQKSKLIWGSDVFSKLHDLYTHYVTENKFTSASNLDTSKKRSSKKPKTSKGVLDIDLDHTNKARPENSQYFKEKQDYFNKKTVSSKVKSQGSSGKMKATESSNPSKPSNYSDVFTPLISQQADLYFDDSNNVTAKSYSENSSQSNSSDNLAALGNFSDSSISTSTSDTSVLSLKSSNIDQLISDNIIDTSNHTIESETACVSPLAELRMLQIDDTSEQILIEQTSSRDDKLFNMQKAPADEIQDNVQAISSIYSPPFSSNYHSNLLDFRTDSSYVSEIFTLNDPCYQNHTRIYTDTELSLIHNVDRHSQTASWRDELNVTETEGASITEKTNFSNCLDCHLTQMSSNNFQMNSIQPSSVLMEKGFAASQSINSDITLSGSDFSQLIFSSDMSLNQFHHGKDQLSFEETYLHSLRRDNILSNEDSSPRFYSMFGATEVSIMFTTHCTFLQPVSTAILKASKV